MSKVYVNSMLLMVLLCSSFFTYQNTSGKILYEKKCARCHGVDGTKGFLFEKDLQKSTLPDSLIIQIISNGKRIMPSFKKKLTAAQINEIASYVKTLRK